MTRLINEALSQENAATSDDSTYSPQRSAEIALALESATLDIQESEHELTMQEYRVSELQHAHASLESIVESLETITAEDERGLDRFSAEGFRHATYAIIGDAMENPIPSLESFGGNTESALSTEESKRSIKEMVSKIWESIKKAVKKAIETVVDFIKKLFDGAEKLHKRTEDLEKKIAEYKKGNYTAKDGAKFEVPFASRVYHDGSVSFDKLVEGVTLVSNDFLPLNNNIVEKTTNYYNNLKSFYTSQSEDTSELEKISNQLAEEMESLGKKYKKKKVYPGGKVFQIEIDEKEINGKKINYAKPTKLVDADNTTKPSDSSIDVPSLDELEKVVSDLKSNALTLTKSKETRVKLNDARKEAYKSAEELVKKIEDGKVAQKWKSTQIRFALKAVEDDFATSLARSDNYVFNHTRAMVSVVDKALDQYGEPESGGSDEE